MREIVVDKSRKAVILHRCFFHPFFPVYRRTCEIALTDIGQSFIARSGDRGRGNKILLPTKRGYVYFRDDRQADTDVLRAIRKAQTRVSPQGANGQNSRHGHKVNRLPSSSKIALGICLILVIAALWFYYSHVLPKL